MSNFYIRLLSSLALYFIFTSYSYSQLLAEETTSPSKVEYSTEVWKLPMTISDKNTLVTFELDSTWVSVHGKTADLYGKIWLERSTDPRSISAEIYLPVNSFKTGLDMRDSKMKRVMAAREFPEVVLNLQGYSGDCQPLELLVGEICEVLQSGTITIRGISREITLASEIEKFSDHYNVSGSIKFLWPAFGIEDPSILVAKLDEEVKVNYQTNIPR